MQQFEDEKKKWEAQKEAAAAEGKTFDDAEPTMDEERERAWQVRPTFHSTGLQKVFRGFPFGHGCGRRLDPGLIVCACECLPITSPGMADSAVPGLRSSNVAKQAHPAVFGALPGFVFLKNSLLVCTWCLAAVDSQKRSYGFSLMFGKGVANVLPSTFNSKGPK